ncbi:MAG: acyl-CoA dehydrogenase family protein [Actinomycetota bacterium]
MQFALSDEHRLLVEETRRRARTELVAVAAAGAAGRVNRPLVKTLGDAGLLPMLWPRRVGGMREGEIGALEVCLVREALASECPAAETALALQGLGGYPILTAGRDEIVDRWVPAIVRGEAVAAFALTEPGAGSDAAALELAAEPDGDGYRLTGEKKWISNAPDADVYTVFARTTRGAGGKGVTAFVVAGDAAGLSGEHLATVDDHPIGTLVLDGVAVGPEAVLGEVDRGFRVAMATLNLFRPSVGGAAVGMAQAALEAAIEHAGRREAFGVPLREFQAVSHRLADMAAGIEAARALVYRAAAVYDAGEADVAKTSAMAKLVATETAQWIVDAAVQIHGAAGLERGHLVEHLYRQVRALRIYEGTSEIQREIIARELYR